MQRPLPPPQPAPDRFAPITYTVFTDLADVAAIAPAWERLLDQSPCNRAFSCADWFLGSAEAAPSISPYVITAWRRQTLAGIFPLAVLDDPNTALIPTVLCDYQDIIAAADDGPVLSGLFERGLASTTPYPCLYLDWMRPDSNCVTAMRLIDPAYEFTPAHSNYVCPYIQLPSEFTAYFASKSANYRWRLRRLKRQAADNGFSIRQFPTAACSPDQIADQFLALHFSRFKAASGLAPARHVAFVKAVLPKLLAERKAEALALCKGDNMIAITIYVLGERSYCLWNGGGLPEARDLQAGTLLIDAGIQRACELGLQEFDFLGGKEAYKYRWATDVRPLGTRHLTAGLSR